MMDTENNGKSIYTIFGDDGEGLIVLAEGERDHLLREGYEILPYAPRSTFSGRSARAAYYEASIAEHLGDAEKDC